MQKQFFRPFQHVDILCFYPNMKSDTSIWQVFFAMRNPTRRFTLFFLLHAIRHVGLVCLILQVEIQHVDMLCFFAFSNPTRGYESKFLTKQNPTCRKVQKLCQNTILHVVQLPRFHKRSLLKEIKRRIFHYQVMVVAILEPS